MTTKQDENLMTIQRALIPGLIVLLFVLSFPIQAQTIVGLRAGVNFSSIIFVNAAGERQHTEMIPRVQAGLAVDIPLAMGLYPQPAAMYVGKGIKQDGGWLAAAEKEVKASAHFRLEKRGLRKGWGTSG